MTHHSAERRKFNETSSANEGVVDRPYTAAPRAFLLARSLPARSFLHGRFLRDWPLHVLVEVELHEEHVFAHALGSGTGEASFGIGKLNLLELDT